MLSWLQGLQDWLLAHAGEWWTYALTAGLCWVDGFFPPLPSESIVIAMASLSLHQEAPVSLVVLVPLVVLGAWLGDNTAYLIGRWVPLHKVLRGPRWDHLFQRADDLLRRKGAEVLLTARFIPLYRVAINMTAGGLRYPWRRFALIDLGSALLWSTFAVAIGAGAGAVFHEHPLLGVVAGVLLGLVVGWVIDRIGAWHRGRGQRDEPVDKPGSVTPQRR